MRRQFREATLSSLLLLALLPAQVVAQFTFATNDNTLTITTYFGPGGVVNIPDAVEGMPVVGIGSWAFASASAITGVSMGTNVVTIGNSAFSGCVNLASVAIGNGVTNIGGSAFYNCRSLINLEIGTGVRAIEDQAFYACIKLPRVKIPDRVISLGYAAFSTCAGLTNLTLGANLTSLGSFAFYYCTSLPRVVIPDQVTAIYASAFQNCSSLATAVLGKGVNYIGDYAFDSGQSLRMVFFRGNPPNNTGFNPFNSASSSTLYYLPGTTGWGATFAGRPTALWNPAMQSSAPTFGVRPEGFGLPISGTTNIPIVLEAATSLVGQSWTPLLSGTLTNGSLHFVDPLWTEHQHRFYRIRSP